MKIIEERFLENAGINVILRTGKEYFGDLVYPQKADNVVMFWDDSDKCVKIIPLDLVKEINIFEKPRETA